MSKPIVDYRFILANERTFLAWLRTGLALVAGGVALDQFVAVASGSDVVRWLSIATIGLGAVVGVAVLRLAAKRVFSDRPAALESDFLAAEAPLTQRNDWPMARLTPQRNIFLWWLVVVFGCCAGRKTRDCRWKRLAQLIFCRVTHEIFVESPHVTGVVESTPDATGSRRTPPETHTMCQSVHC